MPSFQGRPRLHLATPYQAARPCLEPYCQGFPLPLPCQAAMLGLEAYCQGSNLSHTLSSCQTRPKGLQPGYPMALQWCNVQEPQRGCRYGRGPLQPGMSTYPWPDFTGFAWVRVARVKERAWGGENWHHGASCPVLPHLAHSQDPVPSSSGLPHPIQPNNTAQAGGTAGAGGVGRGDTPCHHHCCHLPLALTEEEEEEGYPAAGAEVSYTRDP